VKSGETHVVRRQFMDATAAHVVRRQLSRGAEEPGAEEQRSREQRSSKARRTPKATHLRPMIPITAGAFCSTTETRKPLRTRASEVFFKMLGTSSGRLAS
jgi:hypothetical protein